MQVYGPSQVHGPHGVNAPHFTQRTTGAQSTSGTQGADRVEISPAAQAASQAADADGIRTDLVNQIRSQIAAGTYETPDKMNAALDRLLDQLG
jgi:negative regulator of flagellin synthesis FlgM